MEDDLELDSEESAHGLAAQPVRKNISLKLKTKSSKSSSIPVKTKKKETRSSSDRKSSAEGEKESARKKQRSPASSGSKPEVVEMDWNHKIMIVGQKVQDPLLHLCEKCSLPILVYGRLSPCKHSFCLSCAEKGAGKCPRCGEGVQRIERAPLGSVFVCSFGGSRYGISGCRRSYFSQRDLQSHIKRRHQREQSGGDSDGNEDAEPEMNRVMFPAAGAGVPFFLHPPPRDNAPTGIIPIPIAAGERPFSNVPLPGAVSMEARHYVQTIPRDAFGFVDGPRPQPQHPQVTNFPSQGPPQVSGHMPHVQTVVFPHPEQPPPRFDDIRPEQRVSRPIPVATSIDDGFGHRGPAGPGFRFPEPDGRHGNWQPPSEGDWLAPERGPPVRAERDWIQPPGRTERDWVPGRSDGKWTPRGRGPQGDPHYRTMPF